MLGCTHYPLLKGLLAEVAGDGVTLIDSAEATATTLSEMLEALDLQAPPGGEASARYFVTDAAARFDRLAKRLLGEEVEHIERVTVDSTDSG